MIRISLLITLIALSFGIYAQNNENQTAKKPLGHDVYPIWKNISNQQISPDGNWISYEINPQKGDGYLYLYNVKTGKLDSIPRGKRARIAPSSNYMAFKIVPQYDTLRKMKLDKVPKKKLPKDSLGIWLFEKDSIIKIAGVKAFDMGNIESPWMLYTLYKAPKKPKEKEKKSFLFFGKKKKQQTKKEIKQDGDYLVVFNPLTDKRFPFENIDEYKINYYGNSIALIANNKKDSTQETVVRLFNTAEEKIFPVLHKEGTAAKVNLDRKGGQLVFLFAADTAKKNKVYDMYYWFYGDTAARLIVDTLSKGMIAGWSPSINSRPYFSRDASRIFFGTAPKPVQEPKDTLLPEEKYHVDVWNYKDPQLQPQQKINKKRELRRTYSAVYFIGEKRMQQLADTAMRNIRVPQDGNANYALGTESRKYEREISWDGWYSDYYIVNVLDGSRELVLEHHQDYAALSTGASYLLYYKNTDSSWYAYDHKARKHIALTKGLGVNFYDEENDVPKLPSSYGISGWYSNDKYVVINDRYDLWRIDPSGREKAVNLTKSYGREHHIRFRAITLNPADHWYFNDENPHLLRAFNEDNKQSGFYQLDLNEGSGPAELIMSDHRYLYPIKAKDANRLIWRCMSFTDYPDLYTSTTDFQDIKKISNTNPQQKDYLWGSVELVKWKAFDGQELSGLLYKPENFDSTKKYPVIVYFYEKYSDDIHNHYIPKPSHSIVNFTEYVSNGYIIFVPDITYEIGHPAKSAYNAVVSGTEFIKKYPWVDGEHIGIQGQSWGGYQVAMLVTMTDIYACAEAGAPVSNMFSAYGGIRWGSGLSRAFQYEKQQSRIGATPWENPELYIENSPVFHADKVKTPLLIMHNDADGAVPWWQGIEYFTDLRRLGKQVWMLSYNNDDHNLMKWPNRVDLSIRMMQFFDHFLKGEPMPVWMSQGIPATKKGKENAYELDPSADK